MPIFRKAMHRLADLLSHGRNVTYRAQINSRIARYVTPLLDKLVADDEDGDALRNALIPWHRAERPPIAIYRGDVSTCRIDGPWQVEGDHWFPLGGLILSLGVTAHLNPFEAQSMHMRMQQAIETVILDFVREHDLCAFDDIPEEIDRKVADPGAKAMIAACSKQSGTAAKPGDGPSKANGRCSSQAWDTLCAASQKGPHHG